MWLMKGVVLQTGTCILTRWSVEQLHGEVVALEMLEAVPESEHCPLSPRISPGSNAVTEIRGNSF